MEAVRGINKNAGKKIDVQNIIIGVMLILSLFSGSGIISQTLLSFGIVVCMFVLMLKDKLLIAFPFVIFYNKFYALIFGISVLRIFTLMLIIRTLVSMRLEVKVRWQYLIPIVTYFLFFVFTIAEYSLRRAVFGFLDVVCCAIIATGKLREENGYETFFKIYTYVALVAFISGILANNFRHTGYDYTYEYFRAQSTLEDPNYMGFFYNVALFANVILDLFKKKVKVLVCIVFQIMIFASISMTAILVNAFLWALYLIITKKLSFKVFLIIALILAILFSAYTYGLNNPDVPIVGPLAYRIDEKLSSLNLDEFTTGRTRISRTNLEYFNSSPLYKQLLGGTSVNPVQLDPNIRGASHNEYIDMLLNIGYIGAFFMLVFVIWRTVSIWKIYKAEKDSVHLSMFMNKVMWFTYGLSLTMFTDHRFLLFFLI